MADDTSADVQGTDAPPPVESQREPADDFDKDRAMATIQKLRSFEKDAKAKLARLAELEAQASEREQADLTAAQKAEKKAQELTAKYEQAAQALRRAELKDAARAAADALGVTFAPGALDDALALGLIDTEAAEEIKPAAVKDALQRLQKARPHYFVTPKAPALDAAAKGGTDKKNLGDNEREDLMTRFRIPRFT